MYQTFAKQKAQLIDFWKENFSFGEEEVNAFNKVKREGFIPAYLKDYAYDDVPLPLIREKTISQPTTVMIMTSLLNLEKGEKVFEVGAGSGYQSAIISKLVGPTGSVITTEVIPELVDFARQNLIAAGIKNVRVYEEDGAKGREDDAPFDKIILTAACRAFPKDLLSQLKVGGTIIGPMGTRYQQEMIRGKKVEKDWFEFEFMGPFIFTPLYGKYGFED